MVQAIDPITQELQYMSRTIWLKINYYLSFMDLNSLGMLLGFLGGFALVIEGLIDIRTPDDEKLRRTKAIVPRFFGVLKGYKIKSVSYEVRNKGIKIIREKELRIIIWLSLITMGFLFQFIGYFLK